MKKIEFSPLFWPVKLEKESILVLDETNLPEKENYLKITNYRQAVSAIKKMKARAVGQVILLMYAFLRLYQENKGKKGLEVTLQKAAFEFNRARPTLSFKFLTDMVLSWHSQGRPLDKAIPAFLTNLKQKRINQARQLADLLQGQDKVLTHCNVSGLLPLAAKIAKSQGKKIIFYATETRPYLQGMRLTAWELALAGFNVTLICDNMVAWLMQEGKVNKVVVGADNLAQNGDIANKIGTFQIALLAKKFKIPFYVFCPPASSAKSGKDINIEIRPERELFKLGKKVMKLKGVKGYYPAFDITPAKLISKHIHWEG